MCYTVSMQQETHAAESIRRAVLALGADVCGFAGIERFRDAPDEFSPGRLFPACQTVVCFGVALPKGLESVAPRLMYGHYNHMSCEWVDRIAFQTARLLEGAYGCLAVPLPCDAPYEEWDETRLHGHGLLSMKHAAVCAGLGTLGKSTLLLHDTYGNRLTLGAVLTDLPLPSDPLARSICPPACSRCMDSCPSGAIRDGAVEQRLCRLHTYGKTARGFPTVDCNVCRTVCPMRFGRRTEGET